MASFRSEFVFEGVVCRREKAKAADGINCIEVGQAYGKLPVAFYLGTKKEAQEMFERCPAEGEKVRVQGTIVPKPKVGKGDRVVTNISLQPLVIEGITAGAADVVGADAGMRRRAA